VIEPEVAHHGDELTCRVETPSSDPDDDNVSYTYAWTRNDRPMQAGQEPARVEASRIAKGERWRCTATPTDGTNPGPAASTERTIANTPPGPAVVRLEPANPKAGEPVRCEFVTKSEDPDGDAVRYRFSWQRNGVAQPFADSSQEVPPRLVKAGDRWRCSVVPTDGSEDGPVGGSEEAQVLPGSEAERTAEGSSSPVVTPASARSASGTTPTTRGPSATTPRSGGRSPR
jgi:hypothetical protein